MKMKKIIAAALALSTIASLAACGNSDSGSTTETTTESQTEWTGDNIVLETIEEVDENVDISGQTLVYLGTSDINPTNRNPERSVPLTLFEDVYGASVEYWPTTYSQKFDDLATYIIGGTSPDFFLYEWMAFPYGVSQVQYQSMDELVDFDSPLWAEVKSVADACTMNGEQYVGAVGCKFRDNTVMMEINAL